LRCGFFVVEFYEILYNASVEKLLMGEREKRNFFVSCNKENKQQAKWIAAVLNVVRCEKTYKNLPPCPILWYIKTALKSNKKYRLYALDACCIYRKRVYCRIYLVGDYG